MTKSAIKHPICRRFPWFQIWFCDFRSTSIEKRKAKRDGPWAGHPSSAFARYFRSCSAGLQGKNNGKKHMLIVYREDLTDEIAEEIKAQALPIG